MKKRVLIIAMAVLALVSCGSKQQTASEDVVTRELLTFPIDGQINTPALYQLAPEKFNRWAQKIWLVQNTEDGIDALEDLISFSVTLCFAEKFLGRPSGINSVS